MAISSESPGVSLKDSPKPDPPGQSSLAKARDTSESPVVQNPLGNSANDQIDQPGNKNMAGDEGVPSENGIKSLNPLHGSTDEQQAAASNPLDQSITPKPEASEATTSTVVPLDLQAERVKDKVIDKEDKPEDMGSQSSTTLSGTHTQTQTRNSRRKSIKGSSSNGPRQNGHGNPPVPGARSSKPSFLSRLALIFVPCIGHSSRAHPIEVDDAVSDPKSALKVAPKEKEKPSVKPETELLPVEEPPATPSKETSPPPPVMTAEPPSSVDVASPPALTVVPPLVPDPDLILPPTPTKQLLPLAETEGVTSGAVQPPGSTGEGIISSVHEHHQNHSRRHSREHDTQRASNGDAEESDGTSFTEDEDVDESNGIDPEEDEEDRLIMNGGAGIPIGPDGVPRPLLPPIAPHHTGRKCLVLDLDETLVHSSFKSISQADYVVPVEIEYHWHNVYVIKRPGVDNFLKKMGEIYEVVVFTASLSKYADPVLDKLDIHQVVTHRLFRESCYNHKGNYVKDLSQLGRPIADTIILDNSPASYIFHPNNAVPVSSWFNDPHDTELTDLVPFLTDLSRVDDVRGVLDGGL